MPRKKEPPTLNTSVLRVVKHNGMSRAWAVGIALTCCMLGAAPESRTLYGHRAYAVANESQLISVGKYRSTGIIVKLQPGAAVAFRRMREAAQRDGVGIAPISGFRNLYIQKYVFDKEVKKSGSPERAARWSAPPGYSEHHTGLALDLGDPPHPECDVEPCFEKSPTYDWLAKNAARFGFEISFPKNGGQVQFEPWHWRFVGDAESLKLFHTR
jgi:D-alanyl-D-alanine carboxypeptidase